MAANVRVLDKILASLAAKGGERDTNIEEKERRLREVERQTESLRRRTDAAIRSREAGG